MRTNSFRLTWKSSAKVKIKDKKKQGNSVEKEEKKKDLKHVPEP